MSCGNPHDLPCNDVAQVLLLFIDNEINALHELTHNSDFVTHEEIIDGALVPVIEINGFVFQGLSHIPTHAEIEIHFEQCPPCHDILDRESAVLNTMKERLGQSCREEAPAELQALIAAQTQALASQLASSTTSVPFSRTEITTTIIDENGAQTTIEIQSSTEFRGEFPSF